jgi:hypothetical protein
MPAEAPLAESVQEDLGPLSVEDRLAISPIVLAPDRHSRLAGHMMFHIVAAMPIVCLKSSAKVA